MLNKIFSGKLNKKSISLILVIIFVSFTGDAFGTQYSIETEAGIKEVLLFRKNAAIKRSLIMNVYKGTTEFNLIKIGEHINPSSLKIKIDNEDVNVLSYSINNKCPKETLEKIEILKDSIEWIQFDLRKVKGELDVSAEEKLLLTLNKERIGTSDGLDAVDLDEAFVYFSKKLLEINLNRIRLEQKRDSYLRELEGLSTRLNKYKDRNYVSINVIIYSNKSTKLFMQCDYVVEQSYWNPFYQVDLNQITDEQINVDFNAEIINNTRNDWSNVDVKLMDRFLSIDEVDTLNNYSSDYVFDISFPYHVRGDGRSYFQKIEAMNFFVAFNYEVDVKKEEVMYVAKSFDWGAYDLVTAPIKVFKNDILFHLSNVDVPKGKGALKFNLGKDNRVLFHKEALEEENEGKSKKEAEFVLHNTRGERISIQLQEEISEKHKVNGKSLEVSGGIIDEENSMIHWGLSVKPNSKMVIKYFYQ